MSKATHFENYGKPVRHVRFFALEDFSPQDATSHKRVCPVCKDGLLLMEREPDTLRLKATDCCTLCGQHVIYDDIDRVREERP